MTKRKPLTDAQRLKKKEYDARSYRRCKEKRQAYQQLPEVKARKLERERVPETIAAQKLRTEPKRQARIQANNQECLKRLLEGCVECGIKDILVLEFDHIDETTKTKGVSQIRKNGLLKDLVVELNKCIVLCANCHKKRTALQFGSWRLEYATDLSPS